MSGLVTRTATVLLVPPVQYSAFYIAVCTAGRRHGELLERGLSLEMMPWKITLLFVGRWLSFSLHGNSWPPTPPSKCRGLSLVHEVRRFPYLVPVHLNASLSFRTSCIVFVVPGPIWQGGIQRRKLGACPWKVTSSADLRSTATMIMQKISNIRVKSWLVSHRVYSLLALHSFFSI